MTAVPQPMADGDVRRLLAALPAGMPVARTVSGWATVELDRAEATMSEHASRPNPVRSAPAPDDELLGARCRIVRIGDSSLLLLEPSTEGRLAASLARFGEGPIALYVFIDSGAMVLLVHAGTRLSATRPGPFGDERLVLGGRWGPHLLVVEGADGPDRAGHRERSGHRVPSVP